jgi:hypothetical protein
MLLREKLGAEMMCTAPATHHRETFTNVVVALLYLDIDIRLAAWPAAMLLREKLRAEMMCTAPTTHHVETFTNVVVALRYLDVDRRLPQASCHAAEGEVGG